ncbi:MAG: abortive infection family protein [Candidatus Peribacteraceae bacterium]
MSNLTHIEKAKLRKIFEMTSGYVLDFSNNTFGDFVTEKVGIDIYNQKYFGHSGSKGQRLMAFWDSEPNHLVGKLLNALLEYWKDRKVLSLSETSAAEQALFDSCKAIAERLSIDCLVENIEALQPNSDDKDFHSLSKSISESIARNQPDQALDRLHTFLIKYTRNMCDKHSIPFDKKTPLHSLFGSYVRHLREKKLVESEMTIQILGSSIKVLEEFNKVRNENSYAHDNPILNIDESVLIFNDISNVVRFVESVEKRIVEKNSKAMEPEKINWDDLPF